MAGHRLSNTNFPVLLPETRELHLPRAEFEEYIASLVQNDTSTSKAHNTATLEFRSKPEQAAEAAGDESATRTKEAVDEASATAPGTAFVDALLASKSVVPSLDARDGKMLTANGDVAYRTSGEALVDVFSELEDGMSGNRLRELLDKAWEADHQSTLKLIWNARSIHLGKSSRTTFYRAVGWLLENHPKTLLTNLPWLVRPLISKKAASAKETDVKRDTAEGADPVKAEDEDSDFELIDGEGEAEGQPAAKRVKLAHDTFSEFDVKYGVAHGYWKDLLNILALAANDELKVDGDPRKVLNIAKPTEKPHKRNWKKGSKKEQTAERHTRVLSKLATNPTYKALHLTIARLFADQLKLDTSRLDSGRKREIKFVTLAAKWAPSHKGMHDQHTCIVSTIAELLYPFDTVCKDVDPADRTTHLKLAREAYQLKTLSPLRKVLEVVERPIGANKFEEIDYEKIPSLAMQQYTSLFAKKDFARFDQYLDAVAGGQSRISGATLLPSTLVAQVRGTSTRHREEKHVGKGLVAEKLRQIAAKSADGQWNALVQRIRDSGTMESSIAVCDVSGSMSSPRFKDGTCPMDSAIGLSLLVAEITKAPFGGKFITFAERPQILRAGGSDDPRSFEHKIDYIKNTEWGGSTDFVAVFEKLILPLAKEYRLKQEDMVKQVFVFSDVRDSLSP